VELGGGTGYGAALASEVVGEKGSVLSLELSTSLVDKGQAELCGYRQTRFVAADAHEVERWRGAQKVYVAFAVAEIPASWLDALADGGRLVAPIIQPRGTGNAQVLRCFDKSEHDVQTRDLGPVIYVPDRTVGLSS
jgi:protein-L-isoaspartate(D-aspartate) O-methyltransferase